jgi:hypothetical protein
MIIFCHDPHGLTQFIGETKKKITDYMKRLFNLEQLTLWEARSSIIELPTVEDLMNRLVYFYLNPNRAGLTQSINEYPGLTSWQTFLKVGETLEAREEKDLPWISALKLPIMTKDRDPYWAQRTINGLKEKASINENLIIQPYKCLEAYGLTEADIPNFKAEIIKRVREGEETLLTEPNDPNIKRTFKGVAALNKQEPTLNDWKPKSKRRRIFLICSDPDLRRQMIAEYKYFFKLCRQCYETYLKGDRTVLWPPGAFQPPMPCSHCALSS